MVVETTKRVTVLVVNEDAVGAEEEEIADDLKADEEVAEQMAAAFL